MTSSQEITENQLQAVLIIGGSGDIGSRIARALLNVNQNGISTFKVGILSRIQTFQTGAKKELLKDLKNRGAVIIYADYSQDQELLKAMTGYDTVINIGWTQDNGERGIRFINIALETGTVKRFIPNGYYVDYSFYYDQQGNQIWPNLERISLKGRPAIHSHLVQMAEKHHDFSFTEFVVGCIAYEPQPNFFHIDVKNYSAKVLGDPDQKFMLTFLDDLPDLVVEALKNRSQSRNARLSLCSVYVSFSEILSLAEEITNQSFKRTTIDTQELQANIPGSHKKYTQYLMMSIGGYQPAPLESHECNRIQRKDTDDEFFPQVKRTSLQEWLRACTKCAKQQ